MLGEGRGGGGGGWGEGGGRGGGGGVGLSVTKRYMGVMGILADRYVTLIFNFICLVFSLSIERLTHSCDE